MYHIEIFMLSNFILLQKHIQSSTLLKTNFLSKKNFSVYPIANPITAPAICEFLKSKNCLKVNSVNQKIRVVNTAKDPYKKTCLKCVFDKYFVLSLKIKILSAKYLKMNAVMVANAICINNP